MKKTLFITGSIEAVVGVVLLYIARLIKNFAPILGRVAFQAAMKGSYSPGDYAVNTTVPVALSVILIAAGVIQIALGIMNKDQN